MSISSRSPELIWVSRPLVPYVWPRVSELIAAAMERGEFSAYEPVQQAVLNGEMLLWLVMDGEDIMAAVVTEVSATEWRKVCTIVAVGGSDVDQWVGLIEGLEKYAREMGCCALRIIGRRGWERMLRDYRPKKVVLEKEL